jgi:aspartate dehydrogenase
MNKKSRIGLIGFGYIGSYIYDQITNRPELGLEIAFVHDTEGEKIGGLPAGVKLCDLEDFAKTKPDLVVEMAHPSVTVRWGENILSQTDYMPLSVTAFADQALYDRLISAAKESGTCIYIPHGALVGLDSIFECRDSWREVKVTMKKNPKNLDFSCAQGIKPGEIKEQTVLYEGPTRGICPLFPRNVNAHAACAIGGIGFDKTRSVLIADPRLDVSVIEIEAKGEGVEMKIQRSNKLKGVSGVFTLTSTLAAILRAKGARGALQLC